MPSNSPSEGCRAVLARDRDASRFAVPRELRGVGDEVGEDLRHQRRVGHPDRAGRRRIELAGDAHAEGLMRPHVVEALEEAIEARLLLGGNSGPRV